MQAKLEKVFITGAGSGIGRALAHKLADQGASLVISDINRENLEAVEQELRQKQVHVHARVLDVADKEAVFAVAKEAEELLGGMDGVFNNAGVSLSDNVETMTYEDFHWMMDIVFWGVVHGTKAFLPGMLKRRHGHIINVSSVFGLFGVATQAAYCSAKHAVKGFNESLYYELLDTGVQVHSVHPGGVDTGIVRHGKHINTMSGATAIEEIDADFQTSAITSPDQAADIILDGVARSKFRILVGKDARMMDRLIRWMPNRWLKMFAKRTRQKALT